MTAVEVVISPIIVDAAGSIRKEQNDNNPRGHQQQQLLPTGRRRRRLLHRRKFPSGLTCNLFLKDVEYGPNADKPQGYSIEEWFCELSEDDSHRLGVERPYYLDIADASSIITSNAIPGQSTLITTEASIDFAEKKLYIPTEAEVSVETRTDNTRSRNLMTTKGALDVLMVRITDSKGVAPNADLNQLRSDVFEDKVSLKSQFEACSYGKLQIRPFTGRTETNLQIRNGVVDISVDYDIRREGDRGELQIAAIRSAEEAIGNLRHQFDAVMFCMPPGTGDWLAYAFVGDKLSFYNNEWCSYVSGQLHEVGHNLGLAHSGEKGEGEYFDQSGIMGLSYAVDDQRICFNPAKSWQLGWYDDKVRTIDPLSSDAKYGLGESSAGMFTMNGVADYKQNDSALIVLRLEQTSKEKDYYIGYNRKAGINADSVEDGNKMTIVRKESGLPHEFGESIKVAALSLGESHTIENFNGEKDRDVKIRFIGLRNNNATIKVMDLKNEKKSKFCEDYKINPLTWGKGQRKLTCEQINEKNKCDIIWFKTNRPLWYVCQQSCNKCDKKVPFEDDPFLVDENRIQSTSTSAAEESFASTQDGFLIAV